MARNKERMALPANHIWLFCWTRPRLQVLEMINFAPVSFHRPSASPSSHAWRWGRGSHPQGQIRIDLHFSTSSIACRNGRTSHEDDEPPKCDALGQCIGRKGTQSWQGDWRSVRGLVGTTCGTDESRAAPEPAAVCARDELWEGRRRASKEGRGRSSHGTREKDSFETSDLRTACRPLAIDLHHRNVRTQNPGLVPSSGNLSDHRPEGEEGPELHPVQREQ